VTVEPQLAEPPRTLTVTNDRGLSASTRQTLTTSAPDTFTGTISFSPLKPAPGQKVLFSAMGIQAAPGHSIVQYNWSFGDSAAPAGTNTASGTATPDHTYTNENDYIVMLTVIDDLGRQKTIPVTVSVKFPTAEGASLRNGR
jgi:PKD repeat protein